MVLNCFYIAVKNFFHNVWLQYRRTKMFTHEIFIRILRDRATGLFGKYFEKLKRIIAPLVTIMEANRINKAAD